MADAITIAQLKDASLDAASLGELANGDENTQVVTRTGETYPSAKKAIKAMFENGGLPATPFETKAQMVADVAAFSDGDYAIVTNDGDESLNGYYLKSLGVFKYLKLNENYRAAKTMQYFHGNVAWTALSSIRIGDGASQGQNKSADVSMMQSVKLRLEKTNTKDLGDFNVRIFFHSKTDELLYGDGREDSQIKSAYKEMTWFSSEIFDVELDVSSHRALLIVISPKGNAVDSLLNEETYIELSGTPFSKNKKSHTVYSGSMAVRNEDTPFGLGNNINKASIVDVSNYSAVKLNVSNLNPINQTLIVRCFYFDKKDGLVTVTPTDGSFLKMDEFSVELGETQKIDKVFDVRGYVGFLVVFRFRTFHEMFDRKLNVSLTAMTDSSGSEQAPQYIRQKTKTLTYSYKMSEFYDELKAASRIYEHSLNSIRASEIFIETDIPMDLDCRIIDKLVDDTDLSSIYEYNGTEFVARKGSSGVIIKSKNGIMSSYKIDAAFLSGVTDTTQFRIKVLGDVTAVSRFHKGNNTANKEYTLKVIYRGVA